MLSFWYTTLKIRRLEVGLRQKTILNMNGVSELFADDCHILILNT